MKRIIRKIFIANRGDICRRVALTAKRMGISTSCISGKKETPAFLSGLIDEFIFVENESVSLFLDGDLMIAFAKQSGADAIHPGYGFLSENEHFAQKVLDAKLIWLGPPPKAIKAMAHKSDARSLAIKLGVPCIQGVSVPTDVEEAHLIKLADKIGYPILLKAAKGGGGKGMRVAESRKELYVKAQQAFSEALNAFGDGTLLLERCISQSRHIEVQILGDLQGNLITIGDRDCSLQRRYQKILEEAPALGLTEKTRESLYKYALLLSKEVGYSSCGTIEFLLDWSENSRSKDIQDFFFLEMNTRLQVEHPVTESVFGLDLVEWQIRVGQGESVPDAFKHLKARGHSIEVRLYAEDPSQNFFPSPGKIFSFIPFFGPGVRWDIGIDTVDEVTSRFDPMIAKLIVSADNRESAIERLLQVLQESFFAGPANNLEFLQEVLKDPEFRKGPIDTHYIKKQGPKLFSKLKESSLNALAQTLLNELQSRGSFLNINEEDSSVLSKKIESIFSGKKGDSNSKDEHIQVIYEQKRIFSQESPIKICFGEARKNATRFFYASAKDISKRIFYIQIHGKVFSKFVENKSASQGGSQAKNSNQILSPVPGRILRILVQAEDTVEDQQSLFILDSMKMEFVINAQGRGIIQELKVSEGEQVDSGQILAAFKVSE